MTLNPLDGIKIIEIQGIGPAPFCGMMLADMGAEVIVIERTGDLAEPITEFGDNDILKRGKQSIALNLKDPKGTEIVLKLIESADGLIEGMRPGVMEKLGLGPDHCLKINPRLVFGRVTGWGQSGPLALKAGHDINYISLSGANYLAGHKGETPFSPPSLIGDIGGGALYLVTGMLAGILSAKTTGKGQVIDAAIVDGTANMMNLMLSLSNSTNIPMERGESILNGPHWFDTYKCKCGGYISLGSVEVKFYKGLLQVLSLENNPVFQDQYDPSQWADQKKQLTKVFEEKNRDDWNQIFEEVDICFAPVLSPKEATKHPHNLHREYFYKNTEKLEAAPAPRFSNSPDLKPAPPVSKGTHSNKILEKLGYTQDEIKNLNTQQICFQSK